MNTPEDTIDELAAGPIDQVDVSALGRIADLYSQLDPVPESLVGRVQFGLTLDALHCEIAELQRSSELIGVRSDGVTDVQSVTFTSVNYTTMVTITTISADAVRIDGWVVPSDDLTIELRTQAATLSTAVDEDGRFVFERVARSLAQFVLRPERGQNVPSVITPSIQL